jgi:hypothetical protein
MMLTWSKCAGEWCLLEQVQPATLSDHGVFVVWRSGDLNGASVALYVGRGWLRDEIARCQRNPIFRQVQELRITWARVDDARAVESVAAYLYRELRPVWGEAAWNEPLAVNLPPD